MYMSNYLISISKNDAPTAGIIHDKKNKLKVKAFDLVESIYTPTKNEVRFFVTDGNKKFVFET